MGNAKLLTWIFLIAMLARLAFLLIQTAYHPFHLNFTAPDSLLYEHIAQSLTSGAGYQLSGQPTAYEPPGYPMFLSVIYVLFDSKTLTIGIAQSVIGAVGAMLVTRIGIQLFSSRTGILAGLLFAIYPHSIFWTGFVLTDTLYITLVLAFLAAAVQYQLSGTRTWLCLTSLLCGFILLIRATLLPFVPILLLFWSIMRWKQQWAKPTLLFIAVLSLVLSPWVIRNYAQFHSFILTDTKGAVALSEAFGPRATGGTGGDSTESIDYFDIAFSPGTPAADQQRAYLALAWQGIRERPLWLLTSIPHKLWNMWRPNYAGASIRNHLLFDPPYLFAVIFGIVGMRMLRLHWRKYSLLYLFVVFHVALHGLLYGIIRYRLPVEPVLLLFAAEGFFRTADCLGLKRGVLEGFFQRRRMAKVLPLIPAGASVLDLGCGSEAVLLSTAAGRIRHGIGVDMTPPKKSPTKHIRFIKRVIATRIPVPPKSHNRIVSLAVFGCFDHPREILKECHRILKKDGMLVFTTPLPPNRMLMRVLGTLGILDQNLVRPYAHFYSVAELRAMLATAGFRDIRIEKFQLGFNSLITARR